MKKQSNRNYKSTDEVMTPYPLALALVNHFKPVGVVLEPCKGEGVFIKALELQDGVDEIKWCEISEGRDFFDFKGRVDWIITNPPWSKMRTFLQHAYTLADDVAYLMTINHCWTKARRRDREEAGFGIKEICITQVPPNFPQTGFELGIVHFKRGYVGDIKLSKILVDIEQRMEMK